MPMHHIFIEFLVEISMTTNIKELQNVVAFWMKSQNIIETCSKCQVTFHIISMFYEKNP